MTICAANCAALLFKMKNVIGMYRADVWLQVFHQLKESYLVDSTTRYEYNRTIKQYKIIL